MPFFLSSSLSLPFLPSFLLFPYFLLNDASKVKSRNERKKKRGPGDGEREERRRGKESAVSRSHEEMGSRAKNEMVDERELLLSTAYSP